MFSLSQSTRVSACLVLLFVVTTASAQQVLRIARIPGFPDQDVSSRLLADVYRDLNVRVEFVDVQAKRALAMSSSGALDGETARVIDVAQEYPQLLPVTTPVNFIEPSVFTKGAGFTVDGWKSIADYNIGIVRGVGSSERGVAGMAHVQAVSDQDVLFRILVAGRVDIIVTDLFSGQVHLRKSNLEGEIHALLPPLQRIQIHHYLNEKHRALLARVETHMQEMERSGELARLRDRYRKQVLESVNTPQPVARTALASNTLNASPLSPR